MDHFGGLFLIIEFLKSIIMPFGEHIDAFSLEIYLEYMYSPLVDSTNQFSKQIVPGSLPSVMVEIFGYISFLTKFGIDYPF